MNIQNEKKSEQIQILSIEICKEDYAEKVESALKKQRRTAQIPGFRPGNAPMALIRRGYEKSFIADTINNIMYDELNKFIHENKIDILGEPLPVDDKTVLDFDHPEKFVFTFEIASQKPFDIDYTKLPSFTRYQVVADEEEVDSYVMEMRKRHGKYTNPETISDSDFVTVAYGDKQSGNFYANDLNDEGKALFIGKKKDEVVKVDVNKIFADENKLAAFLRTTGNLLDKEEAHDLEMTVQYIGHVEPAELDEEFFKKVSAEENVTNEEEFRKDAAARIEREYTQHTQRKFMNDAIEVLIDNVDIAIPEDFMKRYILFAQKDMTAETLEEKYSDYEKSFKWQLLENKLTKDNDIKVTQEDIRNYVKDYFMKTYFGAFNLEDVENRLNALVDDTLKNKETVKNIYDQLFDDRIGKALMQNMKTDVKKVTFKEFADELYGPKEEAPKAKKAAKKSAEEGETEEKPKAKRTTKKKAEPKAE